MNKDDKEFLENNKHGIYIILLSIFVSNFEYINMFKNVVCNSIVNIVFGIIIIILLGLFFKEEKKFISNNSQFIKFLVNVLIAIGVISSFYHIGYAVGQILAVI